MTAVLSPGTYTRCFGTVPSSRLGTPRAPGWPPATRGLAGWDRHPGTAAAQIIHSTKPGAGGDFCRVTEGGQSGPPKPLPEPGASPAHQHPKSRSAPGRRPPPQLLPQPQRDGVWQRWVVAASAGTRSTEHRTPPPPPSTTTPPLSPPARVLNVPPRGSDGGGDTPLLEQGGHHHHHHRYRPWGN